MAAAAIGMQLMGGFLQGQAAEDQGKAGEALGKYKAQLARRDAERTRVSTAENQRLMRIEMRKTLARNRAMTGASGVMMAGSPAEHQLSVIDDFGYAIARTGFEGESEARKHEDMAGIYEMEAKSAARAGKLGKYAAWFGAGSKAGSTYASQYGKN